MMRHRTAKRTTIAAVLTLLGAVFAASPAAAMRCSHRLITEGDHASKVLKFCGEPISVESRYAERPYWHERGGSELLLPGFYEEVKVEEWTYNFGPQRFMRLVRLENGVVTDIRQLGYGFLAP
jgi:Protein of unknown function (DUF2845)